VRYEQNVCCASVREPFGHHLMAHKHDRNAKKRACHQLHTGAGDETAHPNDDHQTTLTRHHAHCHRDLLQTPPPSPAPSSFAAPANATCCLHTGAGDETKDGSTPAPPPATGSRCWRPAARPARCTRAMPTSARAAPPPRARARPHARARACKTSKLTRRPARAPSTLVQAHDLRHTRLHARTRTSKFTPHMRGQHHYTLIKTDLHTRT